MMQAQKAVSVMTMGSMSGTTASSAPAGNRTQANSGLGDIIVKAAYVLVPEGNVMPRVCPYLQVKFPTGDEGSALGTGSFAEGAFLELSKQRSNWYSFAEAGYTIQQHSSSLDLKNYLSYDANFGHALDEKFLPMVIVKGLTAPVKGSTALLELRLEVKCVITTQSGIEGYVAKGSLPTVRITVAAWRHTTTFDHLRTPEQYNRGLNYEKTTTHDGISHYGRIDGGLRRWHDIRHTLQKLTCRGFREGSGWLPRQRYGLPRQEWQLPARRQRTVHHH